MPPGATAPQIHLTGPAKPGPWFPWSWPDNRRATAWRGPAQSPGLMGAAVPFVAPHCHQTPADSTGRDQAWTSPSSPRHAPHSRRSQQPAGRPHRPLGGPTAADPPSATPGRGADRPQLQSQTLNGDRGTGRPGGLRPGIDLARHVSASTTQPLPSPSTIQRRPKFARL